MVPDVCRIGLATAVAVALAASSAVAQSGIRADDTVQAKSDKENGYRTFTDSQGRTVEAELLSVLDGKATIRLKNGGSQVSWPAAAFSADDHAYMKEWIKTNVSYRFAVRQRILPNAPSNAIKSKRRSLTFFDGKPKAAPAIVIRGPAYIGNVDDDDSDSQYAFVTVKNGSSADLVNLEVAVWIILNYKKTHHETKDYQQYVVHDSMVTLPTVKVGEEIQMGGNFPLKKIRLKKQFTITNYTRNSSGQVTGTETSVHEKNVGSIRETFAGILIRIYHDGKMVDELKAFDGVLKSSGYDTDFAKPGIPAEKTAVDPFKQPLKR